jgi:hypothetical protein
VSQHRPDAVVIAMADAGVTMMSTLLAIEIEQSGVPTAMLATPLGVGLAEIIYQARLPALHPLVLHTVRTDSREAVRLLLDGVADELIDRLTHSPTATATRSVNAADARSAEAIWVGADESIGDFQDRAERLGIGDGLPLLPPARRAVELLLASVPDDPEEIIFGPAITSQRLLRVRDAAVNAAMTACPPRSFAVVLAALRAMAHPDYRLFLGRITTHPAGDLIVFAGADPAEFGLSGGAGCLGPGHRGNACVGRAVSLSMINLFGVRPGRGDLSNLGSPAEITCCFAETTVDNPWPSLATKFGDGRPGVLVMKAEAPRNAMEHRALTPKGLCEALASVATGIGSNNAYIAGDLGIILNPEHAGIFDAAGWSRGDVAEAIHRLACNPRAAVAGHGVEPIRPRYMEGLALIPATRSPQDVHVVVAGAPGPQSMVAIPWGYSRAQWHPIATRNTPDKP